MIKLKKILKETFERKFGEPLPTFDSVMEKHQNKNRNIPPEESVNEGSTPNDLMKELEKVNEIVIKILEEYEESMPPNYMPRVIQKWMMSLHQDIKKQGYRV
jgi:predicted RNase H-like HicB family nuclease